MIVASKTVAIWILSYAPATLLVAFLAQSVVGADSLTEKLGVTGIVVAGSVYLVRFFMNQNTEKDKRIEALTSQILVMTAEGHRHLGAVGESQEQVASALRELNITMRQFGKMG